METNLRNKYYLSLANMIGVGSLSGNGCDIIATSIFSNAPAFIRSIFPPYPSSAGVPRTVS